MFLFSDDDIAVVVTLDGTMHLVDRVSRKVHWSIASGRPIYSSYQAFHDHDNDKLNASGPNSDLFVDCGEDLQLYVHSWRQGRLVPKLTLRLFLKVVCTNFGIS